MNRLTDKPDYLVPERKMLFPGSLRFWGEGKSIGCLDLWGRAEAVGTAFEGCLSDRF
jgi:hypothetical protein